MRKFKLLKRSVPLWAVLLICAVATTTVIAAMVAYRQVSMTMEVKAHYDVELYQPDHTTVLTDIDLGTFYRLDNKKFPSDAPTSYYFVENIGEANIWVSWSRVSFPTGVTVVMMVDWGGGFQQVNEGSIIQQPLYTDGNDNFKWYFTVTATDTAEFGTSTPVIRWDAYDSASG